MPTIDLPLTKILKMYERDGKTLREIAEHFKVSRQTIHNRIGDAGREVKPPFRARLKPIGRKALGGLYLDQGMTLEQIGEKFGRSKTCVIHELKRLGIERRRQGGGSTVKIPELRTLKVGESLALPKVNPNRSHERYYEMAKVAGIRVSTRSIDGDTLEVTRVA